MKKNGTLIKILSVSLLALSLLGLTACKEKKDPVPPCEQHVDFDGNGGCDVCNTRFTQNEGYTSLGYKLSDDKTYYIVTGSYSSADVDIKIAPQYNGLPIKVIKQNAFSGKEYIRSVVIPDSVTTIEMFAFSGCKNLTSVTLPEGLTTIEDNAFAGCSALTGINLPSTVSSIEKFAFANCTALSNITLPAGLTTLGNSAFFNCTALASITIPDGMTAINEYAFAGCYALTSVTIPDSVTSIGSFAFFDCTGLTSITFADPNGWAAGATAFSSSDLANAQTAASYLTSTHKIETWTKSAS